MIERFSSFSVYWPFAAGVMQRRFAYKMNFFLRIVGGLIQVFIQASLWDAIFRSSAVPVMRGFDRAGILVYVVMAWFTGQLVNTGVEWTVSSEIRQGQIAVNLIRPISFFSRLLAESAGNIIINFLSVVLPAWIALQALLVFALGAPLPGLDHIALYLLSLILAFALSFLFNFLFSLTTFWVTYFWGFAMLKAALVRLLTGELIPLAFFPSGWGRFLSFLPFAGMNATPVSIYLGTLGGLDALQALGIQALWVVLLFATVRWAWGKAIVHLTVMGG